MAFKHVAILALALFSFAGQALALTIAFGGSLGNITIQQLLEIPPGPYLDSCQQQCSMANVTINNCPDDACICSQNTGELLQTCEQCLLQQLVDRNMKMPDPRVGSNPGLAAYVAACQSPPVNATLDNIALTIPNNWTGPTDIVLSTPATVFVVGFGGILGASALFMLSNL